MSELNEIRPSYRIPPAVREQRSSMEKKPEKRKEDKQKDSNKPTDDNNGRVNEYI